jgi:hypothetical protein
MADLFFQSRTWRARLLERRKNGATMRAVVGDRLHVRGHVVGERDQTAVIIEIRGEDGSPPYLIRYDDGHETLVFPGMDASVEHDGDSGGTSP